MALSALLLVTLTSHAQILERKTLSLEAANKIIAGAIAEARANNWLVDIAVDDDAGHLLSFQRMDGALIGSIEVAIGKARTASLFRRPTKVLEEAAKTRPAIVTLPNGVLLQGGVPVVVNGQTVGAVGVSGLVTVNHLGDAPLILGSRRIHSCRVAIR